MPPPPPPPSSATAPTRSASAVSFQASSAPQDTSTFIDTRASDEEEEDFGGADDSFASFDARNSTMALLAEDDWFGGRASMFGAVSGHVASLEATANTYSPDFLDRLVDTLVGTPNFAKDMESSFAEFDENNPTAYSGNAALDDTAYTANTDVNADTSTETANTSTNNYAPKALRFRKIVGASNVSYDDDCEEEKENVSNVAASLRRISKSLPLSISSKKSDGTNETATKNARSYLVEAGDDILIHNESVPYDDDCEEEEEKEKVSNVAASLRRISKSLPLSISSKKSDGANDTVTKNARSYLVEAGDDILIHNETGSVSCSSTGDHAVPSFTTKEGVPPQSVHTTTPPRKPGTPTCDAPLNNSRAIQESTDIPNKAPSPPPPSTSPALVALALTNSNSTPTDAAIVSSVEKLLNEIYGPPHTEFGEQSSFIRARLIVEKYNSRPAALLRVLEKKSEKKAAAKAEVSASEITSGHEVNCTPSTPQDGDESQTTGTPKASNTRGMSFTSRLRSFGRTASKLRSRSIRSGIDHGDKFSTPKKAHRKKQTITTPDTIDENDSDETSFDPLSNIGLHAN